jgi:4-hydroxy-3-polyprenylbenzoate decarboxylase
LTFYLFKINDVNLYLTLQNMVNNTIKIAVGITGASGSIYAKVLLDTLEKIKNIEVACVMSKNAKDVWKWELQNEDYNNYPFRFYESNDFMAPFASGSSNYEALVIAPCSMGTLGRIAAGVSDSLVTRAADVMLKERRKLICLVRDTPYNLIHIHNMKTVTEAGGIIVPASPSFYSMPTSFEQLAATVTDRIIGLLGINIKTYQWGEELK